MNQPDRSLSHGRDIDTRMAELSGEGAQQISLPSDPHVQAMEPWGEVPTVTDDPTYYERPLLKESVWTVDIPLYYFLGGTAGAALTLGAAAQLTRDAELRRFSSHCHWIGIAGCTLGAIFLVHDLGKPSRFLNMVRVFRPTSPMNVGAWILSGAAPAAVGAGLFINRRGLLGLLGEIAGYTSGVFGAALAGYTGVLVSSSAIPVWQASRRWMPILFTASAMASAASILDLFPGDRRSRRITLLFGTAGRLAEIAAAEFVRQAANEVPRVSAPFHGGATSLLWKSAGLLTAGSVVVGMTPGRWAGKRKVAGMLGAAGSFVLRFAVHYISNASARDPRASFHQQRVRAQVTGSS